MPKLTKRANHYGLTSARTDRRTDPNYRKAFLLRITTRFEKYLLYVFYIFFSGAPDQGINMIIILQRRLINEIMTTYLPTTLILIIVYATNFFKPFFFEAVVTVNLTSLLVLTTLFISVSG